MKLIHLPSTVCINSNIPALVFAPSPTYFPRFPIDSGGQHATWPPLKWLVGRFSKNGLQFRPYGKLKHLSSQKAYSGNILLVFIQCICKPFLTSSISLQSHLTPLEYLYKHVETSSTNRKLPSFFPQVESQCKFWKLSRIFDSLSHSRSCVKLFAN